jgi:putative ABC transport system permease protein
LLWHGNSIPHKQDYSFPMFKNYLVIAFRSLQRNITYSFINVTGLSVGIASSILILLWVSDELSFDRFHESFDRIHQVHMNQELSDEVKTSNTVPYPVLEAVKESASQIKYSALLNHGEGYLLAAGENKATRMGYVTTKDFLNMFSFKLVKGNVNTALSDPTSIVLTESVAKALFGDEDPINKFVKVDNQREQKVTGIVKDVPSTSTIKFDFLLPFGYWEATQPWVKGAMQNWGTNGFRVFVQLHDQSSAEDVNKAIADLVRKNNERTPTATLFLHPMEKWRLHSDFKNGKVAGGMIEYVQLFSAIGIFILIIACINFMNLATARSEGRAREVGIRKSVGSRRKQLIVQFLGESILISAVAFLVAVVIVELVLPAYNTLVSKNLVIDYGNPLLWFTAVGLVLLTGFIAGSYPAFYLSSFQPVKVLKGKIHAGKGSSTPRKVLVILQFGFSIFLVIGTIVVYQQIMHTKARHVGYERENLMLIWTTPEIETNFQSIRQSLNQTGLVKSVCKSSAPITRIFSGTNDVTWPGKATDDKVNFTTLGTEYDFAKTIGAKMIEGRDFSPEFISDSTAVVINQAALDLMGMEHAVGAKINMWGADWTIIGVIENIVMGAPYQSVDPLVVIFSPTWSSTISVRMEKTDNVQASITEIEKVFKKFDPEHPLWYRFADEEFESKFTSINLISRLALIFACLAILISSLGLFGLAAFTAEQRTKEVGIRKVLGASVANLVMLMSKDFSRLVVVAFFIAAPFAWWMMNNYLEQYPYRVNIQWWILPAAGIGALTLAVTIVSLQSLRAARNNPVDSLRSE